LLQSEAFSWLKIDQNAFTVRAPPKITLEEFTQAFMAGFQHSLSVLLLPFRRSVVPLTLRVRTEMLETYT